MSLPISIPRFVQPFSSHIQTYILQLLSSIAFSLYIERGKRRFDCNKQKVEGSGGSPQLRTKGSEERITERGDKKD